MRLTESPSFLYQARPGVVPGKRETVQQQRGIHRVATLGPSGGVPGPVLVILEVVCELVRGEIRLGIVNWIRPPNEIKYPPEGPCVV